MDRQGGQRGWLRPPLRGVLAAAAAVALLLAPGLFPSSSAVFSAATSAAGNAVATADVAPPSAFAAAQTCAAGPGISYVGAVSGTGVDSLTLATPTGTAAGVVLVAQVTNRHTAYSLTAPAGWQLIGQRDTSGATFGASVTSAVFYRVATAAEPATATFSLGGSSGVQMVGGVVAYSGVSTSNPVDATAAATGYGTTVTTSTVTTTRAGARLLHLVTKRQEDLASPTGTAERWRLMSGTGTATQGVNAGDETVSAAGATTTRTTTSGANFPSEWLVRTVALRPASGPPSASLSWTASPSAWATDYVLERVVGGSVHASRTIAPVTATSATDGPLVNGTVYTYRLHARKGSWHSPDATTTFTPSC